MPLVIKGKSYPLPGEHNQPGATGRELIEIEEYFGLDAMKLMSVFAEDESKLPVGYTRVKAMFALAWLAMTRAGEVVSVSDVLNDFSPADFSFEDEPENLTEAASLEVAQETTS